jgi:hypothetical protein
MTSYDWILPPRYPLCPVADSFYRTGQAIFQNLNGATPEMFAAARESLELFRAELAQKLPRMHYGLSVGRHRCLDDVYQEAIARLRCLSAIVQPAPQPAPAQKPQPVSLETLLANVEQVIAESVKETPFGEEREEEHG